MNEATNNCFNLTCPLSRFVHLATLVHAQTAPIRFAERAAQVKQMLYGIIIIEGRYAYY